jgi:FAD/FMN-containing dehydrogenase
VDLDRLRRVVGPSHVLTGDLAAGHVVDWTGRWSGGCDAVVRPGSTDEVAEVLALCAASGTAVVPQGGNTGLVGGAVPDLGQIVLSTSRLGSIGAIDQAVGQVTVGSGATVASVAAAARASGWRYPVDFAARDTATIGGTIATNAGGHHVLRHGMTRRHVTGIEAVLADGQIVSHLSGLVKDNTGYDLPGLLCGSEGTLAIVTKARLALTPGGGNRAVALIGLGDLTAVAEVVGHLRRSVPEIEALELMLADGIAAVASHRGTSPPFDAEVVLLVEVLSRNDSTAVLVEALQELELTGSALATDSPGIEALWRWRDSHTEVLNAVGSHPPHKFDVSLHPSAMAAVVGDVRRELSAHDPEWRLWVFGHAGDGNLHLNVTGPAPDDDRVDGLVLELVAAAGGSISAEHGIGRAKRDWLHLCRSDAEIAVFRSIKAALDPDGILNPGVLLP